MLNQDLNAGKFRFMPEQKQDPSRVWALKTSQCPMEVYGEDQMCWDCPDGCPLEDPDDPKNHM